MRYFLGLDLSAQTKLAIESWRAQALPKQEKAVPVANFHITLSFLGQVDESTLDDLCRLMDKLQCPSFSLSLKQMGYWAKPKILFIAPCNIPKELSLLATNTMNIAKSCNIDIRHHTYQPHVTIARGLKSNPPCELFAPDIQASFDAVHLFESVSGKSGVSYPIRMSWPLVPKMSFR